MEEDLLVSIMILFSLPFGESDIIYVEREFEERSLETVRSVRRFESNIGKRC